VAVLADIAGLNMGLALAGCLDTVVAAEAVATDVYVIKIGGQPGRGRVAVIAGIAAGDVVRVFAGCGEAVVA